MWHLAAFTKTSVGNIVDEDIPAVNDTVITISNNHFIPPVPMRILAVAATAVNFGRVKISTPKLRATAQIQFPRGTTAAGAFTFSQVNLLTDMPISINAIDELSCLITTTAVAATQPTCGIWLDDGHTMSPRGEPYWIHGTSTPTGIANGWSNAAITLDQTLPAGRYSVIGMRVTGVPAVVMARLIFPTQIFRPGVPGCTANTANEGYFWENGHFGEYGQFASVAQPLLEVFTNAAGAVTPDVWLQLLRL
jgi:hypothetical protein